MIAGDINDRPSPVSKALGTFLVEDINILGRGKQSLSVRTLSPSVVPHSTDQFVDLYLEEQVLVYRFHHLLN